MTARVMPLLPPPPASDHDLLVACGDGDREALGELFRRHHRTVFRFAARLLGPAGDVDDLVQTTFLTAFAEARRFRGDARVSTWLMGIAANHARHHRRGEARKLAAIESFAAHPPGEPGSLHEQVASRLLLGRLASALERLPLHLRTTYVMCVVEGVPGPEAARALSVPEGTLWRRLHQARRELLRTLEAP